MTSTLGAGVTFAVIAAVVAFLITLLGSFPLTDGAIDTASYAGTEDSESLDVEGVEAVGDMMLLSYTDIINDLVSFQDNPSLERAEARKEAFVNLAESFVGSYQDFSHTMQGEMDELIAEGEALAEE